jgi:hypothetical protein
MGHVQRTGRKMYQLWAQIKQQIWYQSFIYSQTDALLSCLKKILKFTLKQLRHVSVQLHHHNTFRCSCTIITHFGAVTPSSHISVQLHHHHTFRCSHTIITHFGPVLI